MVRSSLSTGVRRVLVAAPLALAAVLGVAVAAHATPSTPPESGDDRAVVKPGNVHDGDCAEAGLLGEPVDVEADIDDNTYISLTDVPEDITITGVVVKGGPAYNVYSGLHEWSGLHAPLAGKSGAPAEISHWFVCGTETKMTTTNSSTSTTTSPTKGSTGSSSTSTSSTSAGVVVTTKGRTTTSAPAVAAASDNGRLANTGFAGGWLLGLAAALLLGGGTVLGLGRRRAAGRRG